MSCTEQVTQGNDRTRCYPQGTSLCTSGCIRHEQTRCPIPHPQRLAAAPSTKHLEARLGLLETWCVLYIGEKSIMQADRYVMKTDMREAA